MMLFRKYSTPVFLLLWFWIWGICPWDSSSAVAQPLEAAHAQHGHRSADDTHHASKGTEHSCSGSISYSSKLQKDRPYEQVVLIQHIFPSTDPADWQRRSNGYQQPLFERSTLPKLLTEYYQLYAVYRI
ncbi:MAG: hypothetical protein MCM46_15900 [Candidatus Manganitrophus sp. SB1]|nr:hypothetical protein [Candidatus Manganitrophus morganii]